MYTHIYCLKTCCTYTNVYLSDISKWEHIEDKLTHLFLVPQKNIFFYSSTVKFLGKTRYHNGTTTDTVTWLIYDLYRHG